MRFDEYLKSNQTPMDLCKEIDELRETLEHREHFVDWVMDKHPACVSEYLELKQTAE